MGLSELENYGSTSKIDNDPLVAEQVFNQIYKENAGLVATGQLFPVKNLLGKYWTFAENYNVSQFLCKSSEMAKEILIGNGINMPESAFQEVVTMSAYIFPSVRSPEVLAHISAENNLEFFINNLVSVKETVNSIPSPNILELRHQLVESSMLLKNCNSPLQSTNKLYVATKNILDQIETEAGNPAWFEKFKELNIMERDEYLVIRNLSNLNEYLEIRNINSGMPYTTALVEYAIGEYIRYDVLTWKEKRLLARIHWLVDFLGFFTNDIFSYYNEIVKVRKSFNGLFVIMLERGLNFREAVESAFDQVNFAFDEYMKLMNILRQGKQISGKYLTGLDEIVKGILSWQINGTERYKNVNSVMDFN